MSGAGIGKGVRRDPCRSSIMHFGACGNILPKSFEKLGRNALQTPL